MSYEFSIGPVKTEDGTYSELKVLQSGAGFYIGREFVGEDGFKEPGSRESDYFPSQAAAAARLKNGFLWRNAVENVMLFGDSAPAVVAVPEKSDPGDDPIG